MCGIVGYVGSKNATPILIEGLRRLEYRGYDSAGVALLNGNGVNVVKRPGKIRMLEDAIEQSPSSGTCGIAHTRWATHGAPNEPNAHPHTSKDGDIALFDGDPFEYTSHCVGVVIDGAVVSEKAR